jgi:hypothetical protein
LHWNVLVKGVRVLARERPKLRIARIALLGALVMTALAPPRRYRSILPAVSSVHATTPPTWPEVYLLPAVPMSSKYVAGEQMVMPVEYTKLLLRGRNKASTPSTLPLSMSNVKK